MAAQRGAVDGKEGEIEVRQLFELEDFPPSASIDRFREMEHERATQKR